ncbi:DUF2207 domain-containing protein [Mycetocola tolaasinivorans]|uniref:DUF2207 domain-containing protein n=1 Tax=Mycetocola tolaasinivorans TaxID=76635 RepID=A0A3L7A3P4_9MICO|nr:DUF2207 domain-containing protein [Mycetocola tolaasinivorans]RLP74734.1 DUF2207 domain-containing protein [Mycetocola tolaasinivorans]
MIFTSERATPGARTERPISRALSRWGVALGIVVGLGTALGMAAPAMAAPAAPVSVSAAPADVAPAPVAALDAAGNVENFTFDVFDGTYALSRDTTQHSVLVATEKFVARFPEYDQNRGIVRALPRSYNGVDMRTSVESVTDDEGRPVPYETERDDDNLLVLVGDDTFLHGINTFVIRYSQHDVTRYFEDTGVDELYRDSIGTQLRQPVAKATMSVTVDAALVPALTGDQACYVGREGSTDRCEYTMRDEGGTRIYTSDVRTLQPGENITMAVAFTRGTFETPVPLGQKPAFSWGPGLIGGGLAVSALLAVLSRRRRNPREHGDGIVVAQYAPQPGIDLGVAADLMDRTSLPQAAMIDLAVRGRVRIREKEPKGLFSKTPTFSIEYREPETGESSTAKVQRALFGKKPFVGEERALDKPSKKLTKAMEKLKTDTREESVRLGLRRPAHLPHAGWWVFLGLVALIVVVGMTLTAASEGGASGFAIAGAVAAGIGFVTILVAAIPTAPLTSEGRRALEHLEGLKLYLQVAEEDRLRILQSPTGAERETIIAAASEPQRIVRLYEALLPYAVLWGVEKAWAETLAVRYAADSSVPYWYVGTNGFNPAGLGLGIAGFNSSVSTASSWSSSGSSSSGGSGGGGFSGGGSGGGGVGGR